MASPASTQMHCPQGQFYLQRYPRRKGEPLQAWCAADLLLLEAQLHAGPGLVVNDDHGALSVALGAQALWTDSALSAIAMQENCQRNSRPCAPIVWSVDTPASPDQVVMRIPKQLAYFEYQLASLSRQLKPGTPLFFAGMDKHLSPHTADVIEAYCGVVQRHRGRRKARLFSTLHSAPPALPEIASTARYYSTHLKADLLALPNVFSREQLDHGTRLLLDTYQQLKPVQHTADLACGNGVLGIAAMQQGLADEVTFADESAMAIASARSNSQSILGLDAATTFHHGDGLIGLPSQFDRILCNPPFHLGHTVDEFAGKRLLRQCAAALRPEGELLLVANKHLPYAPTLKSCFEELDQLARNSKFIVWRARRGCQARSRELC